MEIIDTQSLSNLDLNSKPPFFYNSINICTDAASQQLSSVTVLSRGFNSPAAAARMTNSGDVSGAGEIPNNSESSAAVMWVQKVYQSYRTWRMLADSAVVAEDLRLDIGDGKEVELKDCPRSMLRQLCVKYLGPLEREQYEYIVVEGKIVNKQSGNFLDTIKGMPRVKWIFVKGLFHHSSFLSGGATLATGRLEVEDGTLKICKANEDYENFEESKFNKEEIAAELSTNSEFHQLHILKEEEKDITLELTEAPETEAKSNYSRTLSGGLHSPRAEVPKKAVLERNNSKKVASSYQLGHQLSRKWSTGAGPRIGCVPDYPVELRVQAVEFVNLSPRTPPPSCYRQMAGLASPTACPAPDLYNGHSISSV